MRGGEPPISATATASADVASQVIVDDVEVEHTLNPCSGVEGTFTRTFNGAVQTVETQHLTLDESGEVVEFAKPVVVCHDSPDA